MIPSAPSLCCQGLSPPLLCPPDRRASVDDTVILVEGCLFVFASSRLNDIPLCGHGAHCLSFRGGLLVVSAAGPFRIIRPQTCMYKCYVTAGFHFSWVHT